MKRVMWMVAAPMLGWAVKKMLERRTVASEQHAARAKIAPNVEM